MIRFRDKPKNKAPISDTPANDAAADIAPNSSADQGTDKKVEPPSKAEPSKAEDVTE